MGSSRLVNLSGHENAPHIAHAVQQVAQFCENPGHEHWKAINHIFRYLKLTEDFGLQYEGNSKHLYAYFGQGATNCPPAAMFADSDWANDPDKRKSVGGYVFMMHGGVVDYNFKKFTNTPLSSTEAEWYATCEAAKTAKWIRKFLFENGYPIDGPLTIFEDNSGMRQLRKTLCQPVIHEAHRSEVSLPS